MAVRILKILAIDDNQDNLLTIKALINESFPESLILTALSGNIGFDIAVAEDPDVILLDIVMPGMDGFEVCKKLKSDKNLSDIPVVFITSLKGDKDIRIRALDAGAEAFLDKPIDQSELTAQIRAMIKIKTANISKRHENETLAALVNEQTRELTETHRSTLNLLEDLKKEIEARRISEEAMRISEEKYRTIFENVQDVFYQTNLEGIVLEISPSIKHFSEFNSDEIIGKPVFDLYYNPDDRFILLETIMKKGELRDYELRLKTKTGLIKYASINASLIFGSEGKPDHIDGAIRDITQRKKTEQELAISEARYRTISRLSSDFSYSCIHQKNGFEVDWITDAFYAITGYNSEELMKNKCWLFSAYKDDKSNEIQRLNKIKPGEFIESQFRIVTKKGVIHHIINRMECFSEPEVSGGKRIYGAVQDITDKKYAQDALLESEEKYRKLVEYSPDSVLIHIDGIIQFVNDASVKIFEADKKEDLIGKIITDLVHPDYQKIVKQRINKIIDEDEKAPLIEEKLITLKGKVFYAEVSATPISLKGKNGVQVVARDITERIKAEHLLKESEEKYRLLFENASETILVAQDGMIRFANPKTRELLGYSSEEIISIPFAEFIHPDDRKLVVNNFHKRMMGESVLDNYHFRVLRKDKTIRWVEISAVLFEWEGNVASLNFLSDISEHKLAEDELKLSEEKFRNLYENAPVGLYRTTPEGEILLANRALVQMLGYSSFNELSIRNLEDSGFEPSYERKQFIEQIEKYGKVRDLEAKWICTNGNVIIVKESAKVIYDSSGKILYYDGTVEDITGLKQAENRINLTSKILNLLNNPFPLEETMKLTLNLIQQETGFEATGIRLKNGDDYPYFFQHGFSDDFLLTENTLLQFKKGDGICLDENGKPCLECTCGLVISGKADVTSPLFTSCGSFWTNNSPVLLDIKPADEPRCNPRNRCIHDGYNSVALIPIRSKSEIVGLLQLNDTKKDCFTIDMIHFFESIGEIIGVALMRKQAEEALEQSHKLLFKLSEQVPGVIYQYRLYPDGSSCFPYSSSGMNDIYEYSPDEVRIDATPVFGRIHPDDYNNVSNLIFESAKTLNHFYCEFRVILPRQGLRWRYSDAIPERMDDGSTLWHGIIYDLTDRKNAEQALQSKYDELENFNSLMIGREMKMVELKKEINELLRKTGKEEKYEIFE